MVTKPKKLTIKGLPSTFVEIQNHPIKDIGKRKIEIDGDFLISGEDARNIKQNSHVRLLGLGNIMITKIGETFEGEIVNEENLDALKIQWVPKNNAHEIRLLIPKQLFIEEEFNKDSLEEIEVYTEPYYLQLKDGEEIQFVRFGYCRKDSKNQAIFTHK